jgi:hypothetical protein
MPGTRKTQPDENFSAILRPPRGAAGGFGLLPFIAEPPPSEPATNATWAWSLRRFARGAIWLLPAYALLSGGVALAGSGGASSAAYLVGGQPLRLVSWIGAVWLGLLALVVLTSLLVAVRSRRTAAAGLLTGLTGTVLTLPFVGLPEQTPVAGTDARRLVLIGGAVYSLGWVLTGWAVIRSRVFSYADGGLLMLAAPMLGIGGMLSGAVQAVGAMLTLASGLGVAWRAGRLVPAVGRAEARSATATGAAAAGVTTGGTPAAP